MFLSDFALHLVVCAGRIALLGGIITTVCLESTELATIFEFFLYKVPGLTI